MTERSMAFSPILYRFPGLSRLANREGPQFRSAPWFLTSAARQVLYGLYTVMPKGLRVASVLKSRRAGNHRMTRVAVYQHAERACLLRQEQHFVGVGFPREICRIIGMFRDFQRKQERA